VFSRKSESRGCRRTSPKGMVASKEGKGLKVDGFLRNKDNFIQSQFGNIGLTTKPE